ncbi:MAG: TonB-dependent receptor [Bacteroidetes bacterium]|nr:TonB-dependent receptor [Bacteroidota bacterium]
MRSILTTLILITLSISLFAQKAELRGHVYTNEGEPAIAVVMLLQDGNERYVVQSDGLGGFQINYIEPGSYRLKVFSMSSSPYFENILFAPGRVQLRDSIILYDSTIVFKAVEVRPVNSEQPQIITGQTLQQLPTPDPRGALILKPTVTMRNGRIEVSPAKSGSTSQYGDGSVAQIGQMPISSLGMSSLEVIDRGVPVRYGGFTGGAYRFHTAPITTEKTQTLQFQSSSLFNPYHHNLLSGYMSRAVKNRYISENRKRLVFGYSVLGNYQYKRDPNPFIDGYEIGSNSYKAALEANPLSGSELIGGYVPSASFVERGNLVHSRINPNARRHEASLQFKTTWNPIAGMSLDVISSLNYINQRIPSLNNIVFNSENNPIQNYWYNNNQLIFSHRVKAPYDALGNITRDSNDLISSLYYTLEINRQSTNSTIKNVHHGDDIFNYGYVGKYQTRRLPVFSFQDNKPIVITDPNGEKRTVNGYWARTGYRDTLIGFTPGTANPEMARYTEFIYETQGKDASYQDLLAAGALANGQNMPVLYSLYSNYGAASFGYNKSYQDRFAITAYGEAAFHPGRNYKVQHDLEFGMSFIQDRSGYYNLSAGQLWQLMPLLVNQHLQPVDSRNPMGSYDDQGRFLDSVDFPVFVDKSAQNAFDKNLRDRLIASGYQQDGKPITESTFIDINAIDPSMLELAMFSADDLLNNGNPFVSYSGYDRLGNKHREQHGITSFLNDPTNRYVDAFNPISAAAWIQDKFVFRNLIMRAGFRFERYDANQSVLKDPYSLYAVRTAAEVNELNGQAIDHPASISQNHVVYVNNSANPTSIVGYRLNDQWFDANGIPINDPNSLANGTANGRIQPYLVDGSTEQLSAYSFRNYKAQNQLLPRLSFSFPITKEILVYTSYDKLAQNPAAGLTYTPYTTYFFMRNNPQGVVPNGELKARTKTEYNIGFKQNIGSYASLDLSAAYATIRNDFNLFRLEGAYPYSYTTYSNIDFSTVKRYIAEYEYRATHITLNASYALQFADGTGSNVNSAAALIQSGQPNLRSLFPLSFDTRHTLKGYFIYSFGDVKHQKNYTGPRISGRPILNNTFISLTLQSYSGEPYTAIQNPISDAQADNGVVQRAQSKGNPFGSRMVWRNFADMRIEKAFDVGSNKHVSAYVTVSNLFNFKVIESVYQFTGLPDDDGYLNSPQGQQQVRNQLDAETFMLLYKMRLNNPNNFGAPRNAQLGIRYDF